MSQRYFWINGEVYIEPVGVGMLRTPQYLLNVLCIDFNYPKDRERYGSYRPISGGGVYWEAVDKSTFPKEFLTTVLLLS